MILTKCFFANQVVNEGHSVLVFCSTRKGCETSARHIAKHLPSYTVIKKNTDGPANGAAAVEELRRCSAGLDPVLADTLPAGVAYHHAGLTVRPLLPVLSYRDLSAKLAHTSCWRVATSHHLFIMLQSFHRQWPSYGVQMMAVLTTSFESGGRKRGRGGMF